MDSSIIEDFMDGSQLKLKPGNDLTIISYSNLVWTSLEVALNLEQQGKSVEVIDLRSLLPMDMETIFHSVRRTNRVLIVHEAVLQGGIGAEVAAQIQEKLFDWLDAPVNRIGSPFMPVPASPSLENEFIPTLESITRIVEKMLMIK